MSFEPRTYEQIREDMLAYVRLQTKLTDNEVGSVARTIVEAAALEDDEQYFQMVQLLDAFRIASASGTDLDERVADYGIVRLQPRPAVGKIFIRDEALPTTILDVDAPAGTVTLSLDNVEDFPTAGFPYTVRLGEGTLAVEDISAVSIDVGANQITLAAGGAAKDHSAGDRVSFVSGAADRNFAPGVRVQVPATDGGTATIAATSESGVLVNGNYESTPIRAKMETPGSAGNITSGKISQFAGTLPFDGAGVTNLANFAGGRNVERDADLRDRALSRLQSLSRGTKRALRTAVLGVEDPVTGQRVTTANVLESFVQDEVIVYVDDGTGFTPDKVTLARSSLNSGVGAGSGTLTVVSADDFPEEGYVIVSPEDAAQVELLEFIGVDHATGVITLAGTTSNAHDSGDEVALVDVAEDSAESGQNFISLSDHPVVRDSHRVWVVASGGSPSAQAEDTDYLLNRGTGEIEFIGSGLTSGDQVVAHYSYYTALIAQVQHVINGDSSDESTFPGYRSAGIRVLAETPIVRRVSARMSLSAQSGFQESDLVAQVQEAVEAYINNLGIGEDVIVAEIIERAMSVPGVRDVRVTLPTTNIVVLENELPVPFSSSGDSLITVA